MLAKSDIKIKTLEVDSIGGYPSFQLEIGVFDILTKLDYLIPFGPSKELAFGLVCKN